MDLINLATMCVDCTMMTPMHCDDHAEFDTCQKTIIGQLGARITEITKIVSRCQSFVWDSWKSCSVSDLKGGSSAKSERILAKLFLQAEAYHSEHDGLQSGVGMSFVIGLCGYTIRCMIWSLLMHSLPYFVLNFNQVRNWRDYYIWLSWLRQG